MGGDPDAALHVGLGRHENAKPGVILSAGSQRSVSGQSRARAGRFADQPRGSGCFCRFCRKLSATDRSFSGGILEFRWRKECDINPKILGTRRLATACEAKTTIAIRLVCARRNGKDVALQKPGKQLSARNSFSGNVEGQSSPISTSRETNYGTNDSGGHTSASDHT